MTKRATFNEAFIHERIETSSEGCWNWTGAISVQGRAVYNAQYAYRIAYEIFVGPLEGRQVNHHCDNPRCVNPDHIYAGTQRENVNDALGRNRLRPVETERGEAHHLAYPDALVDEIRGRYSRGERQKDLAAQYGVSLSQVRRWISGGDRGRRPIKRSAAKCGTRSGYARHRAHGEKPCSPCRVAASAYMRDYKAKRLERAA